MRDGADMNHARAGLIRGRLRLEVRANGTLIARRVAANAVLRGGAELVARRLAGLDAEPITAVGVGFGTEAADLGAVALTPPADPNIPPEALRSPVAATDASVATDRPDVVALSLATLFHPTVALDGVTEAGLFANDRLYNQVVFEPVSLKVGQDVTFFWDIDFPFGH
jgi:hypothetical protein